VVIIDSGGANLASLGYALERLGVQARISDRAEEVASADRVILPGVGSAPDAMRRLQANGLDIVLPGLAQPVLGICLGMQLLFRASEEGGAQCLGILPQAVRRLVPRDGLPVPHMGWNRLQPLQPDPLLKGVGPDEYLYFVHGYAVEQCDATVATAVYGGALSAVVRRGNFCGTQFHPERSGAPGARILANFLEVC
jgi:imidazole glycerol-phosphate synthase subunit HisH